MGREVGVKGKLEPHKDAQAHNPWTTCRKPTPKKNIKVVASEQEHQSDNAGGANQGSYPEIVGGQGIGQAGA